MNVDKIVTSTTTISLNVTGITLLSVEEYYTNKAVIPVVDGSWWLRLTGGYVDFSAYAYERTQVEEDGRQAGENELGVRPVLVVSGDSLAAGDKIIFRDMTWTKVCTGVILCDEIIDYMMFREDLTAMDANIYEASDVKDYLEEWLEG